MQCCCIEYHEHMSIDGCRQNPTALITGIHVLMQSADTVEVRVGC